MDNEASPPSIKSRRRYSRAFKEQVLTESAQPGASVAGVAIRHGLNPNMVHKWRHARRQASKDAFVQLPAPPSSVAPVCTGPDAVTTLRMEIPTPRGTVIVHWPLHAIQQSAAWIRELTQ